MCKVCILVPIFNVELYIERCARSLFEQTYPDLEYVFVDDCTQDRSLEILRQVLEDYPDRKQSVRVINHEKNLGLAAARNTALDSATGEFIVKVDSDDWLELNAIELLIKKQQENAVDMVLASRYFRYQQRSEEYCQNKCESKENLILLQLKHSWDHLVTGNLIRRRLFEDHRIRCMEGCDMSEDQYLMTQLAYYAESFDYLMVPVYNYNRSNVDSITATGNRDKEKMASWQYFGNLMGIRDFFADKEDLYFSEASKQTGLFMKRFLLRAVKLGDKTWFQEIAKVLDEQDSDIRRVAGWGLSGIKGILCHNYYLQWLNCQVDRGKRYVKKKLRKF